MPSNFFYREFCTDVHEDGDDAFLHCIVCPVCGKKVRYIFELVHERRHKAEAQAAAAA